MTLLIGPFALPTSTNLLLTQPPNVVSVPAEEPRGTDHQDATIDSGAVVTITAPVGQLDASGSVAAGSITGTAAVAAPAGALSATVIEVFIAATATETAPHGTLASTATEVFSGAASESAPHGTLASAALEVFIAASANETAPHGTLASTASEVFIATGTETAATGSLAAVGQSGSGQQTITGASALTAGPGAFEARGLWGFRSYWARPTRKATQEPAKVQPLTIHGSAGMAARPAVVIGRGRPLQRIISSAANLAAASAQIDGTGSYSDDALALWVLGWDEEDAA